MVPEGTGTARGVIHTRPLLSLYAVRWGAMPRTAGMWMSGRTFVMQPSVRMPA